MNRPSNDTAGARCQVGALHFRSALHLIGLNPSAPLARWAPFPGGSRTAPTLNNNIPNCRAYADGYNKILGSEFLITGTCKPMAYRVLFYSPDTHIEYDGHLPYTKGVGGGITARIRMARALARAGHDVSMVVHCPENTTIDGVQYIPLREATELKGDVLILNTSGGPLDLSPVLQLPREAGLTAVWTSGTPRPGGLDEVSYDFVYAKSNFLRRVARDEWGVDETKIFVAYNGFEQLDFKLAEEHNPERNPHRLVYFSHPSKGLDTAIAITKLLRQSNPSFHLLIFGGNQLWGQEEDLIKLEAGIEFRGLVGQRTLAQELLQCSYSLNLQARLEPFGMVITESMRAGCIVLASPVGAFEELVRHGEDGFLVPGDHSAPETQSAAAQLILDLSENPRALEKMRRNARSVIWDTDTMVKVWEGHWKWWFAGKADAPDQHDPCLRCGGEQLVLADGFHCVACGRYVSRGRNST